MYASLNETIIIKCIDTFYISKHIKSQKYLLFV